MSVLQVANIHLDSTANNRIQYGGTNNINIIVGSTTALTANTTQLTASLPVSVGSNVSVNTSSIFVGNSTINTSITSDALRIGNSTDQQSRVNYLGAFIQATSNPQFTVQWKAIKNDVTNQNEFVTLNSADVIAIVNGGTDYISKCFAQEETLRILIEQATTLEEMLAVDINNGWPNNKY